MTDDRKGGLALIAGALGLLVTMSLHPSGHDLFVPGEFASAARLGLVAHALALATLPLSFLGALALARRLAPDRLGLAGLVLYGFALLAGMIAAAVSGLVAPEVARALLATEPGRSDVWQALFHFNGLLNQAFAKVLVVASSAAIVVWSIAIVRSGALARGAGLYGLLAGPVVVLALVSGHVELDVHGFGLIVLAQSAWFLTVGVSLFRVGSTRWTR